MARKDNEVLTKEITETVETKTSEAKPTKKRKVSDKTQKRNEINFEFMVDYIDNNAPEDGEWFAEIAFENGKYKHFKARKAFVDRYMPELSGTKKMSKWEIMKAKKWVK